MLMLRRQKEPYLGMWAMPGGKVELGEHPDEAMLREFQEETGLAGEIARFCGTVSEVLAGEAGPSHFLLYLFAVRVTGGALTEGPEGPLQWLTPDELSGVTIPSDEWMIRNMLLAENGPRLATLTATESSVAVVKLHR